ncbi:hypothetical protein [Microbacterium sp. PMB16]|uniref:hypothetical protein n=1 Tax=Microbacterium sp. PMB16 TaxID=3120157 RepID=UPI003F4B44BE
MNENAVLDRALSDADPARTPRDAAPDARAIAVRDRILRDTKAPRRHHRRAWTLGWASGIAAAAAAVAIAFVTLTPQEAAVAGSPLPLDFTEQGTVVEIVDAARADLAAGGGPAEPERISRTAGWFYSADAGNVGAKIVPQFSTFVWNADLSGHTTIMEGIPYDPADATANNRGEVMSSGRIVDEIVQGPGEFTTEVPDAPGDSAADVRAMLEAFGMPADPTAFDVVRAASTAFGEWTLTNDQHAQILALVEDAGDAEPLGESTDRLGRPVAGLRMLDPENVVSEVLLISTETGRITGVEETALVDDGFAPAGAITGYRMWDVKE